MTLKLIDLFVVLKEYFYKFTGSSECPEGMIDLRTRCKTLWNVWPLPGWLEEWYNHPDGYSCKDEGTSLDRCWTYPPQKASTWNEAYDVCAKQGRTLITRPSIYDYQHVHTALRLYGGFNSWQKGNPTVAFGM